MHLRHDGLFCLLILVKGKFFYYYFELILGGPLNCAVPLIKLILHPERIKSYTGNKPECWRRNIDIRVQVGSQVLPFPENFVKISNSPMKTVLDIFFSNINKTFLFRNNFKLNFF